MSPRAPRINPRSAGRRYDSRAADIGDAEPTLPADAKVLTTAGIAPALWEALRRATATVERSPAAIEQGTSAEDLRGHVEALFEAIRQAADGSEPRLGRALPAVPLQRVLQRLRTCLIDELTRAGAAVDAGQVLLLLRAVERVQNALDHDEAHRFASRLSGVGSLELLVEVAHDLRSPLASILFLAETLRSGRSGPVNGVQERQLGLIYSAAFGLGAVASDVIELARGGDRLVDLNPVPFSVAELMQSVRDIVQPMAEEKGLAVRLTTPEADSRVGHPGALNRVLLNLTTNALKFTTEGYVELVGKQTSRTRVQFSVRDTGRGIPPEVMSTLFDTFRRRSKPGEYTFSSAGLGLSICRKLVAAMGGELKVETALSCGTRFYFEVELPLASRL